MSNLDNKITCTLKEAEDIIRAAYLLQTETGQRVTVHLKSPPGVGKSSMIKQLAKKLGEEMKVPFGCKEFFLNSKESPDMGGYGLPDEDSDGAKIMSYTRAPWMPLADDPQHGFIFLDEFLQAQQDVQRVCAQLMLDGRVNDSILPITYMVIAASNGENDRSGVNREMAFVVNRTMELNVRFDLDTWTEWAEKNGVHWMITAFAKRFPSAFVSEVPSDPGPFCTARSLTSVSGLIDRVPKHLFHTAAAGFIGAGRAADVKAFMNVVDEIPTFDEVLRDPVNAKLPGVDRMDALYAAMQMVATLVTSETADKVFKYISRMPRDFQIAGLKAALNTNEDILHNEDFQRWCRDNRDLIKSANLLGAK